MNSLHKEILTKIHSLDKKKIGFFDIQKYLGTTHPFLGLTSAQIKTVSSEFKKTHPSISFKELIEVIDSLYKGSSFEEKVLGPALLARYPKYLKQIQPSHLDHWLEQVEGWAEVDSLCQSSFDSTFFLADWDTWNTLFSTLVQNKNIHKRRASLVLLVKPLRNSRDKRLVQTAFTHINLLKSEKEVLITKAISWLLREMTKQNREEVSRFLDQYASSLPKIAVRETRKKLITGKK